MAFGRRAVPCIWLRYTVLCAAAAWSQPLHAEPYVPDVEKSYETVVTARRSKESTFESPRAARVISREEIRERVPATSPEALENAPAVNMQRTNSAGGAPILRGLLGQQILLMVDGVRLNNAITRFGPNQLLNTIDPFQLDRIEVVRGPGSVLYGSDAIGGVINLISRKPTISLRRPWDLQAELLTRFDSADYGTIGRAAVEGQLRRFGGARWWHNEAIQRSPRWSRRRPPTVHKLLGGRLRRCYRMAHYRRSADSALTCGCAPTRRPAHRPLLTHRLSPVQRPAS